MIKIQIENLIECIDAGKIKWTEYCSFRMFQRGIYKKEVVLAIKKGTIIEQYPGDFPYPSCLVVGKDSKRKTMHIVCGCGEENLYIITVYYPHQEKWIDEFSRRKK